MMSPDSAMRRTEAPLLDIRDLRIDGFSDGQWRPILKGLDLTLKRGEVLGLAGESGAGKSSLGLAAMGYARPGCRIVSGHILFDGIDLRAAAEKARRQLWGARMAYVAQSAAAAFDPAHRLMPQVIESALTHDLATRAQAEARARDLFRRLRLPDPDQFGDRFPHQVSGGQLQRAMTAMAMICEPDLIIFDEPTTALDVTTQIEVLAAIRRVVEDFNTAALYITHDLAVVAQMAHRIMVLQQGLMVEEAPVRTLLAAPAMDYTRSLWAVRTLHRQEEPAGDILLSIEHISAAYGNGPPVLDDVSIAVPRGRTMAIVGESGSGKSTLARVISGLLPARSGTLNFAGSLLPPALRNRNKDTLRHIQLIAQSADISLNPRQSLRTIIGRPLELYQGLKGAARDQAVADLLEQVGLPRMWGQRKPAELSGGEKQRVSIARALAARPDLVICDEVTSALDQIVQGEILKLLLRLQREKFLTLLFITHDIATVRAIADEIVVMHQGHVVEQGPKSRILNSPHTPCTKRLLASVPQMDPDWLTRLLEQRGHTDSAD